jgi:hypothetical protein
MASSPKVEEKPEPVSDEHETPAEAETPEAEKSGEKEVPQPEATEEKIAAESSETELTDEVPETESSVKIGEPETTEPEMAEEPPVEEPVAAAESAPVTVKDNAADEPDVQEPDVQSEDQTTDGEPEEKETEEPEEELTFEEFLTRNKEGKKAPAAPVAENEPKDEITFDEKSEPAATEAPDAAAEENEESSPVPERLEIPKKPLDQDDVEVFYRMVEDDIGIIESIRGTWSDGKIEKGDMEKILLSLKILTTHPMLKQLDNVKQLFVQVQKSLAVIQDNFTALKPKEAIQNAKEMLKYIEKENILNNSKSILEQINEIGVQQQKLKSRFIKKTEQPASQLDEIRKKITQKNLIKNVSILESLSKSDRG